MADCGLFDQQSATVNVAAHVTRRVDIDGLQLLVAGRLAISHSDILHRAAVPSRECFEPRLSGAFTFVPR
jgi:hypothetical protein